MQFISKTLLEDRGIRNEGQRFFISCWLESFNLYTIDVYRFRIMNSKSIIVELQEVLKMVEKGIWDSNNVKLVCEEAIKLISIDKVICNQPYFETLKGIINLGISSASSDNLQKISIALIGVKEDLNNNYRSRLIEGLKASIEQDKLDSIYWYTKTIATELISIGHDREFLYQTCYNLLKDNSILDFDSFYDQLWIKIGNEAVEYSVLFKLRNKPDLFKSEILDHKFRENPNIPDFDDPLVTDFLSTGNPKVFSLTKVQAMDPYSAAVIARTKHCSILDLIHHANPNSIAIVDYQCLVSRDQEYGFYPSIQPIDGFYRDSKEWLDKTISQISIIINNDKVSHETKDKLLGALRYFRLSNESTNLEHRFLNLWIALEHLAKTGARHKSVVEPIINYIPRCLAINYISRLINDARASIKHCRINIPNTIKQSIIRKNNIEFIETIRDEARFSLLLNASNDVPYLKYRLKQIRETLSSSKNIQNAIEINCWDINHHLARMYRYRNLIVHSAARDLHIAGITSNLYSYVKTMITIILYQLSMYTNLPDILHVYMKYHLIYDQYMSLLSKDKNNNIDIANISNPLRILWP